MISNGFNNEETRCWTKLRSRCCGDSSESEYIKHLLLMLLVMWKCTFNDVNMMINKWERNLFRSEKIYHIFTYTCVDMYVRNLRLKETLCGTSGGRSLFDGNYCICACLWLLVEKLLHKFFPGEEYYINDELEIDGCLKLISLIQNSLRLGVKR